MITMKKKTKDTRITIEAGERGIGNQKPYFSITGTVAERGSSGKFQGVCFGCIHKEIRKHAPEVSHMIKWHLCTNGIPMHYIANALYWAKKDINKKNFEEHIIFGTCKIDFEKDALDLMELPEEELVEYLNSRIPELQKKYDVEYKRFMKENSNG